MNAIWYVALGSAAGGAARYALTTAIQHRLATTFPLGTLVVNITGSLVLGFVLRYALGSSDGSPEMRALVATGFCGGYTTFSAFSYEALTLMQAGDHRRAAVYVVLSVILSVAAALVGVATAGVVVGGK